MPAVSDTHLYLDVPVSTFPQKLLTKNQYMATCVPIDIDIKSQYLAFGYVRSEYVILQSENTNFERSLINVISAFVGNIFITFNGGSKEARDVIFMTIIVKK